MSDPNIDVHHIKLNLIILNRFIDSLMNNEKFSITSGLFCIMLQQPGLCIVRDDSCFSCELAVWLDMNQAERLVWALELKEKLTALIDANHV